MNIFRFLLGTLFSLTASGLLWSQSTFREVYNPEHSFFRDLVQAPDGGFLLAGGVSTDNQMLLVRTNTTGGVIWTSQSNALGKNAVAACALPGGFAVLTEGQAGPNGQRNVLFHIDYDGLVLWSLPLENGFLPNSLHELALGSDGALFVAGETRDADFEQHFRVLKISAAGSIIWDKNLGFNNFDEIDACLAALPGGQIALGGTRKNASGNRDLVMARLDGDGNVLWLNFYAKNYYQNGIALVANTDGSLVFMGNTYQSNPNGLDFLKVSPLGTEQWYRQYNPVPLSDIPASFIAHDLVRDADNTLFAPVYTGTPGSATTRLLKIAANGDSLSNVALPFADMPWAVIRTGDQHFAMAGETEEGYRAVLVKLDESGASPFNTLQGHIFWDQNSNCVKDPDETNTPPIFMVKAVDSAGEAFYQLVQSIDGEYVMAVSEGEYALSVLPLSGNAALWAACDTPVVTVTGPNQTVQAPDIALQSGTVCPVLDVSIGSGLIRRCNTTVYNVQYCNYGNQIAYGAYLDITYDSTLIFQSSDFPVSAQTINSLHYELGNILPGDCAAFRILLGVPCTSTLGDIVCAEAHIFPDTICHAADNSWDGSNLEVSALCTGSSAEFKIINTGSDMTDATDYVIIEDQIILMTGNIQLNGAADSVITIPNPDGHSFYLRTRQRPGHPVGGEPSAALNACGGTGGPNLALQLPFDNPAPAIATHCDEVIGSYDPNDKRGFPLGWQEEHYIEPGQPIDYTIRFQNTGNDTAFLVVIRDTLSEMLDIASLRPGSSSHPYELEFEGNALKFIFPDILLPDSTVNEPASHGFVRFQINPRSDLPSGALVENDAAIYFDYNEPVITNTCFHTVGQPLISVNVETPRRANGFAVRVMPNPLGEEAMLQIEDAAPESVFRLLMYDAQGHPVRFEQFSGSAYVFQRKNLPSGYYFYQLMRADGKMVGGKIIVR
ncbi:MAG: T9SS type A sorting domain-containing protein [Saprospiraceae bacterium]